MVASTISRVRYVFHADLTYVGTKNANKFSYSLRIATMTVYFWARGFLAVTFCIRTAKFLLRSRALRFVAFIVDATIFSDVRFQENQVTINVPVSHNIHHILLRNRGAHIQAISEECNVH